MGCDDVILDATGSLGHGGRDWQMVKWQVAGNLHASNLSVIEAYLNTYGTNVRKIVVVPRSQLFAIYQPSQLTFYLTLTNFMGKSATRQVQVAMKYDSLIRPRLFIYGPAVSVHYRYHELSLFANATFPSCASNSSRTIPYVWTVFQGMTMLPQLQSISTDPRYFVLPANSLEPGVEYTIQVRASFDIGTVRSVTMTSQRRVQIARGGVKAVIAGGLIESYRLRDTLKLNASRSYELDFPNRIPSSSLTYRWTCVQRYPNFGAECGTNNYFPSSHVYWLLPAYYLNTGIFDITLTVRNSYGYQDQASLTVNITDRNAPGVTVNHTSVLIHNTGDKIILTGSVLTDGNAAVARWKCASLDDDLLESLALTPLTMSIASGSFGTLFLSQLALRPYALPDGGEFIFELTAAYSSNTKSFSLAAVQVRMNDPPIGGVMDVSPTTGYAFATTFLLATSRWSDDVDSLPLKYTFACHTLDALQAYVVKDRDDVTFTSVMLGQGLRTNGWTVYCIANATDVFNGVGSAQDDVQVFPPQGTPSSSPTTIMISSFASSIEGAFYQQNPVAATQLISSALSVLNTVNCDVPTRCNLLNRQVCAQTAGSCGPCLSGYVGVPGDSNTPCNTTLASMRRVGESCRSNSTCFSGFCFARRCATTPKHCPADCNGRGTCSWISMMTGQPVEFCAFDDETCLAVCSCQLNRFGRDCSLFGSQYDQSKSFRRQLCLQLQRAADVQDATATSLRARANAVTQILIDPSVIDGDTVSTCARVLIDTVTAVPTLACESSGANLIMNAMNTMMFSFSAGNIYGVSIDNPTRYDLIRGVSQVLQVVGQECLASQAVGDSPLYLSLDSVRLSSYAVSSATLGDTIFQAAQNPYQQYVQVPGDTAKSTVPVMTLNDELRVLSGQDTMGVTILQYNNYPQQIPGKNNSILYLSASISNAPKQRDVISLNKRRLAQPLMEENADKDEDAFVIEGILSNPSAANITAPDVDEPTVLENFGDDAWSELLTVEKLRHLNVMGVFSDEVDKENQFSMSMKASSLESASYSTYSNLWKEQPHRLVSRALQVTEETVLPMSMVVTLPNVAPVYYNEFPNITITLQCHRYQDTPYEMNRTCPFPGGPYVSVICPANAKGIYNVTCPYRVYQPVCLSSVDGGISFTEDRNCHVVSFSPENTTCACESVKGTTTMFIDPVTGRRLQQVHSLSDGEAVMVQLTTSYKLFTLPVETAWLPYPPLLSVEENVFVFTTLYVCIGLASFGLFCFFVYDRSDYYAWQPVQDKQHSTRSVRTIRRFFREMILPPDFLLQHRPQDVYQRSALSDAPDGHHTAADTVITRGIEEPWRRLFIRRLWAEHSLLSLWSPSSFTFSPLSSSPSTSDGGDHGHNNVVPMHRHQPLVRSIGWLQVMTKFLAVMCLDTIATSLFYADDGTCAAFTDLDSCESERNPYVSQLHKQQCTWRSDNLSCIYHRPDVSFHSVIVFSVIVSVCARPLYRLIEILCMRLSKFVHQYLMRSVTKAKQRAHDLQSHPGPSSSSSPPLGKPLYAMGTSLMEKRGIVVPYHHPTEREWDDDHAMVSSPAKAKRAAGQLPYDDEALMKVLSLDQASPSKNSVQSMEELAYFGGGGSVMPLSKQDSFTLPSQMKTFAAVYRVDELSDCQTMHGKLIRSARLLRMQQNIDYLLPTQEVDRLLLDQQRQWYQYGRRELLVDDETVDVTSTATTAMMVVQNHQGRQPNIVLHAHTSPDHHPHLHPHHQKKVTLPASQPVVLSDTPRHNRYAASMLRSVGSPADSLVAATVTMSLPALVRKVETVRRQAEFIKEKLDNLGRHLPGADALYAQDAYLFQRFLVHLYPDYRAKWLARFVFFGSQQQQDYTAAQTSTRLVSVAVGLPALWAACIYTIAFLNTDVGSRASGLWVAVLVLTLSIDYFIAEPVQIWWQWMVVVQYSGLRRDISKLVYALERRYKYLVATRVDGLMTDGGHALVQHFNPACRIARLYPHLPIARLLLSLNDYDVPIWAIRGVSSSLPTSVQAGGVGVHDSSGSFLHLFRRLRQQFSSSSSSSSSTAAVYDVEDVDPVLESGVRGVWRRWRRAWLPRAVEFFASLPYSVQDTLIDLVALAVVLGTVVVFYLFAAFASLPGAIVVAVLLVVVLVLRETRVLPSLNPTHLLLHFRHPASLSSLSSSSAHEAYRVGEEDDSGRRVAKGGNATTAAWMDLGIDLGNLSALRSHLRPKHNTVAIDARPSTLSSSSFHAESKDMGTDAANHHRGVPLVTPHAPVPLSLHRSKNATTAIAEVAPTGKSADATKFKTKIRSIAVTSERDVQNLLDVRHFHEPPTSQQSQSQHHHEDADRDAHEGLRSPPLRTAKQQQQQPQQPYPSRRPHSPQAQAQAQAPHGHGVVSPTRARAPTASTVPVHIAPSVPILPIASDTSPMMTTTTAQVVVAAADNDEQLRAMQRAAQRARTRNSRLAPHHQPHQHHLQPSSLHSSELEQRTTAPSSSTSKLSPMRPRTAGTASPQQQQQQPPHSGRSSEHGSSQNEQALAVHRERVRRRRERTRHSSETDDHVSPGSHRRSADRDRDRGRGRRQTPQRIARHVPVAEPVAPDVAAALQQQTDRAFSPFGLNQPPLFGAIHSPPQHLPHQHQGQHAPTLRMMPYVQHMGTNGLDSPAASRPHQQHPQQQQQQQQQQRPQFPSWHAGVTPK
jgi:hypothetical protein